MTPPLILITGATGWLGRRLLDRCLAEFSGSKIRALVQPEIPLPAGWPSGVEIIRGDLTSPDSIKQLCDRASGGLLFHTAGVIHPRRVRDFYAVNVDGTESLLSAASANSIRRAIVVSSNSPCGCNPHPDHLFDEESPYHPYMNYGRSKMLMELAVMRYFQEKRLDTVIIRAPWFYGPGQPARQTLFFRMIREGRVPIVGSGSNLRSMGYVDNLCDGMVLAANAPVASGKIYWLADRQPYSMNQIVDTVEKLLEGTFQLSVRHRRVRLPGILSDLAYLADKGLQSVGMYNQKIHVLSEMNKTIACSIEKAQRELGYEPKVALEEGMRRSIQWCIEQGHNL